MAESAAEVPASTPPVAADAGAAPDQEKSRPSEEQSAPERTAPFAVRDAAPSSPELELGRGGPRRLVVWVGIAAVAAAAAFVLVGRRGAVESAEPVQAEHPSPLPPPTPQTPVVEAPAPAPAPIENTAADAGAGTAEEDVRRVVIRARPDGARIYRKGKEVGESPYTLELKPGERRAFEVIKKGFRVRKVVVDGSKPEVVVGLRPEADATTGSDRATTPAAP